MKQTLALAMGAAIALGACVSNSAESARSDPARAGAPRDNDAEEAGKVLDDFHDAAAKADFNRYFGHMTPDAVFLGTDATERWDRKAFQAYCRPYFDKGQGWTYRPHDRHIVFGTPGSRTAWFDELLDNDNYGTCRGSGVLILGDDGRWRIAQYDLSMPVPNDLARDVVRLIREMPKK